MQVDDQRIDTIDLFLKEGFKLIILKLLLPLLLPEQSFKHEFMIV